jgi:hypothetical protein
MSSGAEYRAYIVGREGHFLWSKEFVAENDDDALEYARRLVDGHDVELWSGERLVAKKARTSRPDLVAAFLCTTSDRKNFIPGR